MGKKRDFEKRFHGKAKVISQPKLSRCYCSSGTNYVELFWRNIELLLPKK